MRSNYNDLGGSKASRDREKSGLRSRSSWRNSSHWIGKRYLVPTAALDRLLRENAS